MKKYVFREYKFWYKNLFNLEKKRLLKILPSSRIEHVGSTSIPGLGGKGIIDILVELKDKNWKKKQKNLINRGYQLIENGGDKNRIALMKNYGILLQRRVHVHLVKINNPAWKEMTTFKENLLKSPKLVKEYAKLKKKAVKLAKGDGKIYRKIKNNFIKNNSK